MCKLTAGRSTKFFGTNNSDTTMTINKQQHQIQHTNRTSATTSSKGTHCCLGTFQGSEESNLAMI